MLHTSLSDTKYFANPAAEKLNTPQSAPGAGFSHVIRGGGAGRLFSAVTKEVGKLSLAGGGKPCLVTFA